MASNTIRTGVIGCGGMGRHHVATLAAHQAFDLVAGCDRDPKAFRHLPQGVPRYDAAEVMFQRHQLDLACLILPNCFYEPMVNLACEHGVCVFTEKPFGHSLASARNMAAALDAAGLRAWVGGQRKYHKHFRQARQLVAEMPLDFVNVLFTYFWSPAFEDPGWRGDRAQSGGVAVIDSGWHVLDCLDWFLGPPESVFCQLTHLAAHPETDDKAAIQLRYPSGAIGNLVISYTLPQAAMDLTFAAGRRSLYLDYDALALFDGYQETRHVDGDRHEPVMTLMYDELARAVRGDPDAYITDARRAERIMRVVDACYRSAAAGQMVRLD